jgi:hypothetical protein
MKLGTRLFFRIPEKSCILALLSPFPPLGKHSQN